MAWEAVDFFVASTLDGAPVEGVLARVFDTEGTLVYTEGTTDEVGKVSLLLPIGSYSARFYKFGVAFGAPQLIQVETPPVGAALTYNSFKINAQLLDVALPTDTRLCRCSGHIRAANGAAQKWFDMRFSPLFTVAVVEGSAIIGGSVSCRTDSTGWASVDLVRGGQYQATLENLEGTSLTVNVPDLPSANLSDVLFPVVASIRFEPVGAVAGTLVLGVDGEVALTPVVRDSSGRVLTGTAASDVKWSVTDTDVVSLRVTATEVIVRALAAGSAQITATRRDNSIVVIPDRGIDIELMEIVVT